jgi:pterin-4a-carbinolamine dehydratase
MAPPRLLELEEDEQLAELVKNWKFEEGLRFQTKVCLTADRAVHHASSSLAGSFSVLAIFRRYTFRLTEKSVSLALHACVGGSPAGFHVSFVKDRHFKFAVSCK